MLTPDQPVTKQKFSDADYLAFDPFQGDEAEIKCRTKRIRTARKQHLCYTLTGRQDHHIEPGQRYRHERALIDGSFWGEYRICLSCIDQWINEGEEDDADD
ncbi:hypothetical protein [Chromobacterium violaceum]|uniref:Uncharacterized protein n=1 Tax=Chromobacterium violaceum TaxID=536 RepID=A0A202BD51_CHRVL|nr:hypothetical protein [Chromobacterium violaceum]MCD0492290.1 hypothetical protein [Chromobacterium violaceum]OVE49408.1 hypothetical protein CBW21_05865 [Chromobacterium violaceum]